MRAEFAIEIDGLESKDRFIIGPHETSTIERFLEGNLKSGSKFKFVSDDDPAVQNPGSSQNGIVRVKFWKEFISPPPKVTFIPSVRSPEPWDWDRTPYGPFWSYPQITYTSNTGGGRSFGLSAGGGHFNCCANASQVGATVEGSESNQNFVTVNGFTTEVIPTILQVTLRGVAQQEVTTIKYCSCCGVKVGKKANYCAGCGQRL